MLRNDRCYVVNATFEKMRYLLWGKCVLWDLYLKQLSLWTRNSMDNVPYLGIETAKTQKIALPKNFVSDNVTVLLTANWEWESECCCNSDIFWLLSRITQTSSQRLFQMTIFFKWAGGFVFTGYSKHIMGHEEWEHTVKVGRISGLLKK